MRKEEFCEVFGDIRESYVAEARAGRKTKQPVWLKWGAAAACLCLMAVGVFLWHSGSGSPGTATTLGGESGAGDAGSVSDGTWQEGIDPVTASVAVLPAGESLLDVADATLIPIDEADAKNVEALGAYLPDILPEGVHYGAAGYYETTMKDGTRYHMIRVTYESGVEATTVPIEENAQASSEAAGNTAFLWMVWGHRPDTSLPIYRPNEVTAQLLEQQDGRVFYLDYGGIYVGISQLEIGTEELLAVIDSVG